MVGWGGWAANGGGWVPRGLSNVVALSSAPHFALASRQDGTVVGWGDRVWVPYLVPEGLSNIVDIQAGESFAAYRQADGGLVIKLASLIGSPVVPYGASDAVAFAGRGGTNYFVKANGHSYAWVTGTKPPRRLVEGEPIVSWAAGDFHVAGLRPDGTVVCFGGRKPADLPKVPAGLRDVTQVSS